MLVMIMEAVMVVMTVKKRKPCTYKLLVDYIALLYR